VSKFEMTGGAVVYLDDIALSGPKRGRGEHFGANRHSASHRQTSALACRGAIPAVPTP